jgi:diguanylate cyclase (GGDEF)-like protein
VSEPPDLTALLMELANSAPRPWALFQRGTTEPLWANSAFIALAATGAECSNLEIPLSARGNSQNKDSPWVVVPLSDSRYFAVFWEPRLLGNAENSPTRHPSPTDHLTQLPTRSEFESLAEQRMRERHQRPFGLLFLDLDDFKQVNDSQGHLAGDEQLRHVGEALKHSLREGDFVARFGGDEFVALIAGHPTAAELEHLADRLRRTIKQHAHIGASIGSALSKDHSSLPELLTAADRAMYADKNRRSGGEARL